jgi:hypothetical protein
MSPKDPQKAKEARLTKFIRDNASAIAGGILTGAAILAVAIPTWPKWGVPAVRWIRNADKLDQIDTKVDGVASKVDSMDKRMERLEGYIEGRNAAGKVALHTSE